MQKLHEIFSETGASKGVCRSDVHAFFSSICSEVLNIKLKGTFKINVYKSNKIATLHMTIDVHLRNRTNCCLSWQALRMKKLKEIKKNP